MNGFTGTWQLTRLAVRRDRWLLPIWIAVFVLTAMSTAQATMALYPDEQSRLVASTAVNQVPSAVAMYGRIWDPASLGALSLLKLGGFGGAMLAILAIMLVVRHTRAEEEKGRTELVGATVVGDWAWLASAFAVTSLTMLLVGLLSAASLVAVGLPARGSLAFGLAWAATGIAFAAVACVTAQLASTGRAANVIAMIAVGVAFLLRAVGDVTGSATEPAIWSWLSPIGWGLQVRPFAGDRFVVLLLPLAFAVLAVLAALALVRRRDLGAGLLPDRAGRARAARWLASPLGLAWRQQRGLLLGWAIAYAISGSIIGSMINNLADMMDTPAAQQMITALGGTDVLMDAFISMEFSIIAFVTAAYGIAATRRLATEEADGHLEPMLATAVSRWSFVAGHLVVAVLGTVVLTVVQGLAFGLAQASTTGSTERLWPTVGAALAYLPAVWIVTSLVVLLFGFVPRLTSLTWAVLVAFVLISEVGALLEWPSWVMDASPFAHAPRLPAMPMEWGPTLVMTGIALGLVAAGAALFRARDLDTP